MTAKPDIVERLEVDADEWAEWEDVAVLEREAAAEITRLRAALKTARNDALEEAAKVADADASDDFRTANARFAAHSIASAIRALKEQP